MERMSGVAFIVRQSLEAKRLIHRTRYRILFPNPAHPVNKITHWIFAADQEHRPILYGHAYFAFFTDGTKKEGYQLHREFNS
jgi:hypothetical protein